MADPQSNAAVSAYPLPEPHSPPAPPELPPDAPRAGVLHVRHRHTERYTVVGNHLAQHPRLSGLAIGIGVHIQSMPDGAPVTVKALALRFPEGEVTIGRALRELEAAGYLVRRRVPLGGGRFATRTFFLDHPGAAVTAPAGGSGSEVGVLARVSASGREPEAVRTRPEPESVTVPVAAEAARRNSVPDPVPIPDSPPAPVRTRPAASEPVTVPVGPAAELLARLRLADSRLLLSERDVRRLVPAVEAWLARSASPDQIVRTLTATLPSEGTPIRHPAGFLDYRLTTLLPPPLPTAPARTATVRSSPVLPMPLVNCDGCDRGFRSRDPSAVCRDCRERRARRSRAEAVHSAA
ncbi:hypothetical protein ACFYPT_25800 [Streptomyces sp. NPDC005529]|uniref:hypothetical protein n=1 Tax=unclassified Streptomyces TaxID=2593676 RepID=UPI0033B84A3C